VHFLSEAGKLIPKRLGWNAAYLDRGNCVCVKIFELTKCPARQILVGVLDRQHFKQGISALDFEFLPLRSEETGSRSETEHVQHCGGAPFAHSASAVNNTNPSEEAK
jgi:hypothetical protein